MKSKSAAALDPGDFLSTPVWRYVSAVGPGEDESWMAPVSNIPVADLADCAVGLHVTLADGTPTFALIFRTFAGAPELNAHAQSFVFLRNGQRCPWSPRGGIGMADATHLAAFLEKLPGQIFPFTYDLTSYATGVPEVLCRLVLEEGPDSREPWEIAFEVARSSLDQGRQHEI